MDRNQHKIRRLAVLGIGHLLVDLSGGYLILYQNYHMQFEQILFFFIAYNLIAFALQPFIGFYADVKQNHYTVAFLGFIFVIFALAISDFGIIAVIITALGNAMYHVGAGVLAVNLYPQKAMPAGVFVAPGAFGVFLALTLSRLDNIFLLWIGLLTAVVMFIYLYVFRESEEVVVHRKVSDHFILIIILIFTLVFIRGYIGSMLIFTWRTSLVTALLSTTMVFAGKFLGGILGDLFGYKKVGIIGLIGSAPFLLLGYSFIGFGLVGALLFNLTMAITLFLIIDSLGMFRGFAFGLTTLSLSITYLLDTVTRDITYGVPYAVIILVLVVLGAYALHLAVNYYNKGIQEG